MKKITLVSLNHYCKLVLRGGIFLFAIYLYLTQWRSAPPFGHETDSLFLMVVWMLGLAETDDVIANTLGSLAGGSIGVWIQRNIHPTENHM